MTIQENREVRWREVDTMKRDVLYLCWYARDKEGEGYRLLKRVRELGRPNVYVDVWGAEFTEPHLVQEIEEPCLANTVLNDID